MQTSELLLLSFTLKKKASVWWYPAQVAGDPGESSWVATLTTSWRNKWHNANFSVETIALLIYKRTTAVSLQHKADSLLMCDNCYLKLGLPNQRTLMFEDFPVRLHSEAQRKCCWKTSRQSVEMCKIHAPSVGSKYQHTAMQQFYCNIKV
jgi:hypothetical protein